MMADPGQNRALMMLATLGPVGFFKPAPGSWGSAAAVVLAAILAMLSPWLLEIATPAGLSAGCFGGRTIPDRHIAA